MSNIHRRRDGSYDRSYRNPEGLDDEPDLIIMRERKEYANRWTAKLRPEYEEEEK